MNCRKQYSSIVIPDTIEETELDIILGKGDLGLRVPLEVTTSYKKAVEELNSRYEAEKRSNIDRGLRDAKDKLPKLEAQTRLFLANRVLGIYSWVGYVFNKLAALTQVALEVSNGTTSSQMKMSRFTVQPKTLSVGAPRFLS